MSERNLRGQKTDVKTRNVVLKIRTYDRLEKYKVELVRRRENPRVTYDDAINDLLDNVVEKDVSKEN